MSCHICGNSAIGLCRHCYKFYCQEHGDGFCASCQQKGWQLEQNLSVFGYTTKWATSIQSSNKEVSSAQTDSTETETSKPAAEAQPAIEEKSAAEAHVAEVERRWLDQVRIEEITEPAKFISLLPVFGASRANDVLMLLKGIELYEEVFSFDLSIVLGASAETEMMHRHPDAEGVILKDDVGTVYTLYQQGGSGSGGEWRQKYFVMPPLNPDAKQLTLEIPRLNIMEHHLRTRGHRSEPTRTLLNGPWTITSAVPARDKGISLR